MNQNRRAQLPVTKLIPYLGLHKKSINTCKVCNWMHNAKKKKRFPFYEKKKTGTKETAAPAVSELIKSKLEVGPVWACVPVCVLEGLGGWGRLKRPKMWAEALKSWVSPLVLSTQLQARDLFNSLQLDLLRKLTVAPDGLNIAVMNHLHRTKRQWIELVGVVLAVTSGNVDPCLGLWMTA